MELEDWLRLARSQYDPEDIHKGLGVVTQTRFGAMEYLLETNDFAERLGKTHLNILVVGPGGESEFGYIPYELYELCGYLGFKGIDYDLSVVDILPDVMNKIVSTKRMAVSLWDLIKTGMSYEFGSLYWPMYCKYVGEQAIINPNQEVYSASLPRSFSEKLKAGQVLMHVSDIAQAELPENHYDLVICRNVLYQISEAGNLLALNNISRSMNKNALLWVNCGMIIGPNFVSEDFQDRMYKQEWFSCLHLKKGDVLARMNNYPVEFLFYK